MDSKKLEKRVEVVFANGEKVFAEAVSNVAKERKRNEEIGILVKGVLY